MWTPLRCILALYLIEILHQTTTRLQLLRLSLSCILSKFYIKPQLAAVSPWAENGCILSKFYIKPQLIRIFIVKLFVVSYRNSTSNHNEANNTLFRVFVVSYRNSTSNHNAEPIIFNLAHVVSYRNSTSNHNSGVGVNATMSLYLIEILHQTTTPVTAIRSLLKLYLIEILHQTTTIISTLSITISLYLIEILHQTTTQGWTVRNASCCILSKFYIKPQRWFRFNDWRQVVSYRNSTSNHNSSFSGKLRSTLYLIEILHQTTTKQIMRFSASSLYLIEILHQTTTKSSIFWQEESLYLIEILHQTTTASRTRAFSL